MNFLYFRDLAFTQDSSKFVELRTIIQMLLAKKVNQRCCNVTKLKSSSFFDEIQWEDFVNFKTKPPYIPDVLDWKKCFTTNLTSYESVFNVCIFFHLLFIYIG